MNDKYFERMSFFIEKALADKVDGFVVFKSLFDGDKAAGRIKVFHNRNELSIYYDNCNALGYGPSAGPYWELYNVKTHNTVRFGQTEVGELVSYISEACNLE